jgi:hypothetical protein
LRVLKIGMRRASDTLVTWSCLPPAPSPTTRTAGLAQGVMSHACDMPMGKRRAVPYQSTYRLHGLIMDFEQLQEIAELTSAGARRSPASTQQSDALPPRVK